MAVLINAKATRQLLLDVAKNERHHAFTRVSKSTVEDLDARFRNLCVQHVQSMLTKETLETLEAKFRNLCVQHVKAQPSKGTTL